MRASKIAWTFTAIVIVLAILFGVILAIGILSDLGGSGDSDVDFVIFIVVAIVIAFLGMPAFAQWLLHELARAVGVDLIDVAGGWLAFVGLGLLAYVFLCVPIILSDHADTLETFRASVRSVLAAKPPRTEGGAAECRLCGGALDVPAGALGVRCVYCNADNLVAVATAMTSKASAEVAKEHRDLESADAGERKERATLRAALIVWAFPLPILFFLGGLVTHWLSKDPGLLFWHRAATPAAAMFPSHRSNPVMRRDEWTQGDIALEKCGSESCTYYYVALRKGEKLEMEGIAEGWGEQMMRRRSIHWYKAAWTWTHDHEAAVKGAPYTGWYRLKFVPPVGASHHVAWRWTTVAAR
jgi:LSD1 subclass zinc finger protein